MLLLAAERRYLGRKCSEIWLLIAVSHVVLYCAVLTVGRFSHTIGLFVYCVAGNFLLLRVALLWDSFIKVYAVFGLFWRNIFLSKSIVFVNLAEVAWFVLTWSDVIAAFFVRFCSLDARSNRSSLEITWSRACDPMAVLVTLWKEARVIYRNATTISIASVRLSVTNVPEWIALSSVGQLLLTYGPFYKIVTTRGHFQ